MLPCDCLEVFVLLLLSYRQEFDVFFFAVESISRRVTSFTTNYFRIVRGVDRCGIERDAVHALTCKA